MTGNVYGNVTGIHYGNVSGNVTGNVYGNVTGNVYGNVTGNVYGNVTGNLYGNVSGNVTGNLYGNVSGNVGSFTGNVEMGFVEIGDYRGLVIETKVTDTVPQLGFFSATPIYRPITAGITGAASNPNYGNVTAAISAILVALSDLGLLTVPM